MNDRLNIDGSVLERARVRVTFDRAAAGYDRAANLQRRAAERLLARVQMRGIGPATILDAGCGTGYGARLLAMQFPRAALCCLDIAPSMLATARERATGSHTYVCADAERLPLRAESIDLLWSNAMLQWCNDLRATLMGFGRVMKRGGLLAFATFGPRTLTELRMAFDDGYTHVSRFADVDAIGTALEGAGFDGIDIESRSTVLRYPDVASLMRSLKTIGAGNATAGRARGLTGKTRWRAMSESYETLRGPEGLPATYELVYVTAYKA
jgi:malonyl-CoA O-methyltransferase